MRFFIYAFIKLYEKNKLNVKNQSIQEVIS
jgi:hypothetical protein